MSAPVGHDHDGPEHDGPHHDGSHHDGPGPGGPGHDGHDHEPAFAGPIYATPPGAPTNAVSRLFARLAAPAPRWSAPAAIAACFLGAASYVWVSNPTDSGAYDMPGCLVKATTGLDCPGCGGTRAFYYLMHGNIPEAVRHHAMAVFAAPFLVWMYVAWSVRKITGRRLPMPSVSPRAMTIFLSVWSLYWVARNLPFAPFTSLYV